ncbi:hypothetical protein ACQEU5_09670 [Marinactinospora thermotolerans]|uniref:Uncharacterized protein n=1 Tax=Marinactinospora thermotolerans DSM 45154 TaxID=1122192 RepID=A0A1T4NAQ7_9ACTN|nr:hypothetical protein [Marinactinospora thermotolerans]SJZ76304.1 hypothetical protein SAMN02745673_01363 [Marinactinospora thermotolerans DSM 45154]
MRNARRRDGLRRGHLKGALGSLERPASPLLFRLVLAVFGVAVLFVGALSAALWAGSAPLTLVLSAGCVAACLNVYWVWQRLRHER